MAAATGPSTLATGLGTGLGGLIGGLFGGGSPNLPNAGAIQGTANSLSGLGQNTATTGQSLLQQGNALTPQMNQVIQTYLQTLGQNPYTSTYDAAQEAGAVGQAATNLAGEQAQTTEQLAQRGLAAPGGASSPEAGALTAEQMGSTNELDSARNALATQAIQQQLQNQAAASGVISGEQNQLIGQGNQTSQTGANIENMSADELLQYLTAYNQANQQQSQASSGLGSGLGSLITTGLSALKL